MLQIFIFSFQTLNIFITFNDQTHLKVCEIVRNGPYGWLDDRAFFPTDGASTKMEQNNVFTVAKRKVDGQDMVYQSLKFSNGLWALAELKIKPGSSTIGVSVCPIGRKCIIFSSSFSWPFKSLDPFSCENHITKNHTGTCVGHSRSDRCALLLRSPLYCFEVTLMI